MRALMIDSRRMALRVGQDWFVPGECEPVILAGGDPENGADLDIVDQSKDFYPDVYLVPDYNNNPLVEAAAVELHDMAPFDVVVGVTEFDLIRAARFRAAFGLAGQTVDSALAFRDKLIMKRFADRAGIPVAPYRGVSSPLDLQEFIDEHGYPVVIKPRAGSGGNSTEIITNTEDLARVIVEDQGELFDYQGKEQSLVEAFVTGDFYHVDGLIADGKLVFVWPARYIEAGLSFKLAKSHGSHMLGPNEPLTRRLREFARNVIEALPSAPAMAFHCEVFHTPDDRLVLCEIASRPAGGCIHRMLRFAYHIDLNQSAVRAISGLPLHLPEGPSDDLGLLPFEQVGWIGVPPRRGALVLPPPALALPTLRDFALNVEPNQVLSPATWCCDHIAEFVIGGTSSAEIRAELTALSTWFRDYLVDAPKSALTAATGGAKANRENSLCCR